MKNAKIYLIITVCFVLFNTNFTFAFFPVDMELKVLEFQIKNNSIDPLYAKIRKSELIAYKNVSELCNNGNYIACLTAVNYAFPGSSFNPYDGGMINFGNFAVYLTGMPIFFLKK